MAFNDLKSSEKFVRRSRVHPDMVNYAASLAKLPAVMKRMGFTGFRAGQGEAVHSILKGMDTLVLLPTGTGKTATWLIPALCNNWSVVVFSPLLALIADQAQSCSRRKVSTGELSGDALSVTNAATLQAWANGGIQVLFTAPERIRSDDFQAAMAARSPDVVVVDEAHTLFEWEGFRQFHGIKTFVQSSASVKVVVGLTATATKDAEQTIYDYLGTSSMNRVYINNPRENLLMSTVPSPGESEIAKYIVKMSEKGSGIVYCQTKAAVENMAAAINSLAPRDQLKPPTAVIYYGGGKLQSDFKQTNHSRFMTGESPVMVATNAYGMGIDKADIRWVIHVGQPKSLEAYVQECGRGGRDGKICECVCFASDAAKGLNGWMLARSHPTEKDATALYKYISLNCEKDGTFRARNKDIAEKLSLDASSVSSLINAFEKSGVLKRTKVVSDVVEIGLALPLDSTDGGRNYDKYRAALNKISREAFGVFKVSLADLSEELDVKVETVRATLNKWKRQEFITYNPPPSGDDYEVKKDMEGMSFAHLDTKRKKAFFSARKLEEVLDAESQEDKQSVIDEYFKNC